MVPLKVRPCKDVAVVRGVGISVESGLMNGAEITKLNSGLRVVRVPVEGAGSVTVMALVGVGARYEPENLNGISHFLEHVPFKGTAKWSNSMKLSSAVDAVGGQFNAFTGKEYTGYYVRSTPKHLKFDVDVVSDLLYGPKLRAADIEMEKGVIVEEIRMYNDMPKARVYHLFDRLMYGDSGLGRRIDGSVETVRSFERADFLKWRQGWYGLENVVVVVAGAVGQRGDEGVVRMVGEYFGSKALEMKKMEKTRVLEQKQPEKGVCKVEFMESDQAHLILGFPALPLIHPDRYALAVLSNILGGSMSSRLFSEVREKRGLAYYVNSDVDRYLDCGCLAVAAGVDTSRIDEAMDAIEGVLRDVAEGGKKGVKAEEVRRAQEYYAGNLMLSLESNRSMAQYWGVRSVLGDEMVEPLELVARVRGVKVEDVARVARELIRRERTVLAVVGPYKDGKRFEGRVVGSRK